MAGTSGAPSWPGGLRDEPRHPGDRTSQPFTFDAVTPVESPAPAVDGAVRGMGVNGAGDPPRSAALKAGCPQIPQIPQISLGRGRGGVGGAKRLGRSWQGNSGPRMNAHGREWRGVSGGETGEASGPWKAWVHHSLRQAQTLRETQRTQRRASEKLPMLR